MNYFEFYAGDYMRDTAELSLAEHGAYLLLMASYYSNERPLPADIGSLHRIARAMNKAEQSSVTSVAERFFPVGDDGLRHNKRADGEIEKAKKRINCARGNGAKGGRPPKPKANPAETQQEPSGFHSANPAETQPGKALQTPDPIHQAQEQEKTNPSGLVAAGKPAASHCPHTEIVALYHELLPSLTRVRDWTPERQAFLRKRWTEKTERQSLDWWRTFFEYVGRSDFLTGRKAGRGGEPFECDLEWLVRPKNFVKVIEGKYENRSNAA